MTDLFSSLIGQYLKLAVAVEWPSSMPRDLTRPAALTLSTAPHRSPNKAILPLHANGGFAAGAEDALTAVDIALNRRG